MATETEPTGQRAKKRTRIMIDVSPELRRRIKLAAAREDVTLREYLERIIDKAVPTTAQDEETQGRLATWEAVQRLREIQETIRRAHPGVVFEDSGEAVRRMREERSEYLGQL